MSPRRPLHLLYGSLAIAAAAATAKGDVVVVPSPALGVLTIQQGLDAANDGDVVRILAGEYRENVSIANKTHVRIEGEGKVVVDARPQGATGSGPAFTFTNCDEGGVFGIEVRNASGTDEQGAGILALLSDRFRVEKVLVRGCSDAGIHIEGTFAKVIECRLEGNAGGVEIDGISATVRKTEVSNDRAHAIDITGDDGSTTNCIVSVVRGGGGITITGERPIVLDNVVTAVLDAATRGITTTGGNPKVRRNVVAGCDDGIYVVYGAYGDVTSNVVRNCSASGLRFGTASHHLEVRENLVQQCGALDAAAIWIEGDFHIFEKNVARECGGDGFMVLSAEVELVANRAEDNVRDGFDLDALAFAARLTGNVAARNGGEGFENSGTDSSFTNNVAKKNRIDFASDGTILGESGNSFVVAGAPLPEID